MISNKLLMSIILGSCAWIPELALSACVDDYPEITVVSIGGGQSSAVNETMSTTFRGHIMTTNGLTNHGRNAVTVCRGTTVDYGVGSTIINGLDPRPDCSDKSSYGSLNIGDKLSCNNVNLGGSDTDRFTVKAGR